MSPFKKLFRYRSSLIWKLTLVNAAIILIVIWLTGVMVKDFACALAGQYRIAKEQQGLFNSELQAYLLQASTIAILIAAVVHFIYIRRMILPLRKLAESTQVLASGEYPKELPVSSKDEVGSLTRDFNQLTSALKEMEQSRKQMLSDVSHELRTPISNINGYLEALSLGVIEPKPELFESLYEESVRLTRLVDHIHLLSSWEAYSLRERERALTAMDDLVTRAVQTFSLEFQAKGISIETSVKPGIVYGSPDGLTQAIGNLLHNAASYTRGDYVRIRGEEKGDFYRVSVTNPGPPIPADQQFRLFERFYRADPSRNRRTGGSGLGLAIVKEIVEQHGGNVGLETDGQVHTFWFTIPTARE